MAHLTELQIEKIKERMLNDENALKIKFNARKTQFDTMKVLHSEVEAYENIGWIAGTPMKTKTPITRKKEHGRQFEDDIWCMFYNLGFRTLNADENLRIQWGDNEGEDKQIDILAVGDDAIFVVECKAAEKFKKQSFQHPLNEMELYKKGMAESLQQIYGANKRVKFIFATRNYRIEEDGDDAVRMKNSGIFHLNENSYNYICNLIKSYKSSVAYQFYGMMFKDELINDKPITIPALKGQMGGKSYYLFSIEPSTLLKIGFVLHRTKVNDSMAPTYQRLLVPKRLKGITKFIDDGGFFPNSIILNLVEPNDNIKVTFDSIHKEEASDSEFGLLHIPNAYGIAYIIDGQHRVYGYSNSKFKDVHTIPVVAFQDMPSEEQLKIFMEINENQKSVSKNLRIDLEEDLFWTSPRLDSRMKALRSSTIKMLSGQSNNILYNKISIGEDQAELSSVFFDKGLSQSGLIPKAKQTKWIGETDSCLYDINETNIDKAMRESRKRIVKFLNGCYEIADACMDEETKIYFLFSNRATFPFITLSGLLHNFLFTCGEITTQSTTEERIGKIKPYIECLCNGLNNLPENEEKELRGIQGQGAETKWLRSYQSIIHKQYPEYAPDELMIYLETQDQNIQDQGNGYKDSIKESLRTLVFDKLHEVYGNDYMKQLAMFKHDCEGKIIKAYKDNIDFNLEDYDWKEWLEIVDYKSIIEKNFSNDVFAETFGIPLSDKATSKKEKLSWLSLIESQKGKKKTPMTRSDVNKLWIILDHLNNFKSTEG